MHRIKRLCLAALVVAMLAALVSPASALECDDIYLDGECLFIVVDAPLGTKNPLTKLDPEVTNAIRLLPWAKIFIDSLEQSIVYRLEIIARISPDLFWYLIRDMKLPDDLDIRIAENPLYSQPTSATLASLDLTIGFATLSWVRDGLTETEHLVSRILYDTSFVWPVYAKALLRTPWLRNGIDQDEVRFIDSMFGFLYIVGRSSGNVQHIGGIVAQIMVMPIMDTIDGFEPEFLWKLSRAFSNLERRSFTEFVAGRELQALQGAVSYIATNGGITDEQALFLIFHNTRELIDGITDVHDPKQLAPFLDPVSQGIVIEERHVSMPLAGRVTLVVIRDGLVSTRTMDIIEESVRDRENTMGEIFPTKSVAIVLQGDASYFAFDGIRIAGDVFDDEAIVDISEQVVIHELSHYYWNGGPKWITEGAAMFLGIRTGRLALTEFRELGRECPVDSIVEINNEQRSHAICPYTLGGSLFLELYDNLGDEAFAEAFGDIYYEISVIGSTYAAIKNGDVWYAASNRCLECAGLNPGLYYVQRAFLNSASPESAADVERIVSRWYYGGGP